MFDRIICWLSNHKFSHETKRTGLGPTRLVKKVCLRCGYVFTFKKGDQGY